MNIATDKKWSNEQIESLIELRNSLEWEDKFEKTKGKAKQSSNVWKALAREISSEISGVEARLEYNYLLNQYKKHKIIADKSGEGAIRWKFYSKLKNCLLRTPSITPLTIVDSLNTENPIISQPINPRLSLDSSNDVDNILVKRKKFEKESTDAKFLKLMEDRNQIISSVFQKKT